MTAFAKPPSLAPFLPPVLELKDFLAPIEMENIDKGGYKITHTYKPGPDEAVLLRFDKTKSYLDITTGYGFGHFEMLLEIIHRNQLYAKDQTRMIACRAYVGKRAAPTDPDAEFLEVSGPNLPVPFPLHYRLSKESFDRDLPAPVLPIMSVLPKGAGALVPIGRSFPALKYVMTNGAYAGRLLSKCIRARHYLIYGGKLETDPEKRGMDCTTYVEACYQGRFPAGDGVALCRGLGASAAHTDRKTGAAMKTFLTTNSTNNYIVLKFATSTAETTSHVVAYSGGVIHQFNKPAGSNGYKPAAVNSFDFGSSPVCWQAYTMP